eukprot:3137985-Heterocapsa_arctica.AAC.1
MCCLFQESGKCRFGAACSFSRDAPPNIKSDKKPEKGAKQEIVKKGAGKKEDGKKKKKGRPGAVAEVASSSD